MPQRPTPKRRRLHIVRLATLVTLLISITLWLTWLAIARSRLKATLAKLHAAGESVDRADLPRHILPTTLPSSTFLHQAIAATSNTPRNYSKEPRRHTPQWGPFIDGLVTSNAAALKLVRQSRPFFEAGLTSDDHGPLSALWLLLLDASLRAHQQGDDAEAVELLLDARHIAWCASRSPGFLFVHRWIVFADRQIDFDVVQCLAEIAPSMSITGVGTQTIPTSRPASRDTIKAMIAEFLDDREVTERTKRYFRSSMAEEFEESQEDQRHLLLLKPLVKLALAPGLDALMSGLNAVGEPDSPSADVARKRSDETISPMFRSDLYERYPRLAGNPRQSKMLLFLHWRDIAERRMIATDLAIQLFRADKGKWPDTLSQLLPEYLAEIPRDPYDPIGRPMEYMLAVGNGKSRPILKYNGRGEFTPPDDPQYKYAGDVSGTRWLDVSDLPIPAPPPRPTRRSPASRPATRH